MLLPDGRRIPVELRAPRSDYGGRGSGGNVHVTVGVSADRNGNLTPFVESVAESKIRKAAPSILARRSRPRSLTLAA